MGTVEPFWRALEAIPGQSDVISEWRMAVGEAFEVAQHFLRPTERRARAFRCPSPGGAGCPRRVVVHDNGDIVAVCANVERECDPLALTEADLIVHTLDRPKLGAAVAAALDVQPAFADVAGVHATFRIGMDRTFAGKRFPVLLTIQASSQGVRTVALQLVDQLAGPFVLLIPTSRHVEPGTVGLLAREKAFLLPLEDILGITPAGVVEALRPPEELLADFRQAVAPTPAHEGLPELFPTPNTASWEKIVMEFLAEEVMVVKCGQVVRRVEPDHLGMKNRKSGKPTLQWTLLRTLAKTGGVIPLHSPRDHDRVKKQKSELAKRLKAYFQLPEEPIVWKYGAYAWEARFRVRSTLRQDASDENKNWS